jgi:hypothetical protein
MDTVLYFEPNSELLVHTKSWINNSRDNESEDTLMYILKFELFQDDTTASVTDFRKRSKWVYEKTGTKPTNYSVKYTTEVNETDF